MGTWGTDSTNDPTYAHYYIGGRHTTIQLMGFRVDLLSDYATPDQFDEADATQLLQDLYDALDASPNFANLNIARTYTSPATASYTP